MMVQPVSIRQPEIGALVAGRMTLLLRPVGRLATLVPGDLLWVREPFCLPKRFDNRAPSLALALNIGPVFLADLRGPPCKFGLGRPRFAREMCKAWHRQHLRIDAITRSALRDVSADDLAAVGWASRSDFEIRWDADAGGSLGSAANRVETDPEILRLTFTPVASQLPGWAWSASPSPLEQAL